MAVKKKLSASQIRLGRGKAFSHIHDELHRIERKFDDEKKRLDLWRDGVLRDIKDIRDLNIKNMTAILGENKEIRNIIDNFRVTVKAHHSDRRLISVEAKSPDAAHGVGYGGHR